MQHSWLVRRRTVVLIPARGSARSSLPGDAALRKLPTSLLVGPPANTLHQHLYPSDHGLHACLWCSQQVC